MKERERGKDNNIVLTVCVHTLSTGSFDLCQDFDLCHEFIAPHNIQSTDLPRVSAASEPFHRIGTMGFFHLFTNKSLPCMGSVTSPL